MQNGLPAGCFRGAPSAFDLAKRLAGTRLELGSWRVPKRDLVGSMQVLLQTKRLKIAKALVHAPTLVDELLNFRVRLANELMDNMQEPWERAHEAARKEIQKRLKAIGGDPWGSIPAFLDQQWTRVGQLDAFFDLEWKHLGLPGAAPHEALLDSPAWRLYFEGIGAIVYERAFAKEMPKRVDMPDVMLLTYLGGSTPRIIVTEDKGLQRVASAVLLGRYAGARVMCPNELIDSAA
jgi:hypothetical protein